MTCLRNHWMLGLVESSASPHHSLPPPDFPPWDAQVNDVFFAGSIRQKVVDRKSIFHIPNPRRWFEKRFSPGSGEVCGRKKMEIEAPTRDGIRPSCRGLAKGTTMSPDDYMKEMANSKICLAPRGTSFETFRHYEAASVGCVVVSYRLPPTWFYRNFLRRGSIRNIPFVFVKDWHINS